MSALDEACVVIPTRNEAENIERLLRDLRARSKNLRLLVVDDASPDGTGEKVRALEKELAPLRLLAREGRRGRGSAVLDGLKLALEAPETKFFVEMDADFSHEPSELAALVAEVSEGRADMAVGSRYHPDSRIEGWPLQRKIFSRCANFAARLLLGLKLSDCTNGFRAYSRAAVEALPPAAIRSEGFFALSEIAVALKRRGLRFSERPSVFVNRKRGTSNLGLSEIVSAFVGLLRLALK